MHRVALKMKMVCSVVMVIFVSFSRRGSSSCRRLVPLSASGSWGPGSRVGVGVCVFLFSVSGSRFLVSARFDHGILPFLRRGSVSRMWYGSGGDALL